MERERTDPAGVQLEGGNEVGAVSVSSHVLSCAVCCVPLGSLVAQDFGVPGEEGNETLGWGHENSDGGGFNTWIVCDFCRVLALRSLDTLRRADGCVEPGGDWVSRDGYVWPATPEVAQPANVVETGSDSDGRGRAGGCSCGEVGCDFDVPGDPTPSAG